MSKRQVQLSQTARPARLEDPAMGGHDRRATVLVMVVALLGMLFIVGATMLSNVTFESKSIDGARVKQERQAVVDRILGEVNDELVMSYLGRDGLPYNRDTAPFVDTDGDTVPDKLRPDPIGRDSGGEIAGVHPLIASLEPHEDEAVSSTRRFFFFASSDLEMAINGESRVGGFTIDGGDPHDATNLIYIEDPLTTAHANSDLSPDFDQVEEVWEGDTKFYADATSANKLKLYRRDADGDGVWDSPSHRLDRRRYPDTMRRTLAGAMREPGQMVDDYYTNAGGDASDLFYAVRVIPHGAMVDVNHAHRRLINEVVHPNDAYLRETARYIPQAEESSLRRRFLMPPRELPLSQMQSRPIQVDSVLVSGDLALTLYEAFFDGANAINFANGTGGDVTPRWWPISTGADGDLQGLGSEVTDQWIQWLDPHNISPDVKYDYRHLVTTISHDDQFMRMPRVVINGVNTEWLQMFKQDENAEGGYIYTEDAAAIDSYPYGLIEDPDNPPNMISAHPLNGRVKLSLPGLVETVIRAYELDAGLTGTDLQTILALPTDNIYYVRLVNSIQDAFLAMMQNVSNGMTPFDKANIAAALTANLIDYVDDDDVPTAVDPRHPFSGTLLDPNSPLVDTQYGIEAQPFITEVAYDADVPRFSIELFNPFEDDVDLEDFKLSASGGGNLDHDLSAENPPSIPAGEYKAIKSGEVITEVEWVIRNSTVIDLIRTVGGVDVVVDRFKMPDFVDVGLEQFDFGMGPTTSRQRMTGNTAETGGWTAVVSRKPATGALGPPSLGPGGDGADNTDVDDPMIRPVHIHLANSGNMARAFPTTGSLLLLLRYANTEDEPFTTRLADDYDYDKIDNGRMPIFDRDQLAVTPATEDLPTLTQEEADRINAVAPTLPWGQLIFDYFTALPLSHSYNPVFDASVDPYEDYTPTVDMDGTRVHGRIDINSAPWKVLAGLPIVPMAVFDNSTGAPPSALRQKLEAVLYVTDGVQGETPDPQFSLSIGERLAKSIVAYRESRRVHDPNTDDYIDFSDRSSMDGYGFAGFRSVGELANVRKTEAFTEVMPDAPEYFIDSNATDDFISAAAMMIALGDWVTTRSQVFTVYGTVRGAGRKSASDRSAIRFQETIDRFPTVFDRSRPPQRIGQRVVGPYAQATSD